MELGKLAIAVPYHNYSEPEIDVLADIWVQDLQALTDEEFRARVQEHRRTSKWWPSAAELLEQGPALESKQRPELQLPEQHDLTEQQIERNKAKVGEILEMLKSKQVRG